MAASFVAWQVSNPPIRVVMAAPAVWMLIAASAPAQRPANRWEQKNEDGSVEVYFGPDKPTDPAAAKNWIQTMAGRGDFAVFRFYSPTAPLFDGSWLLPDIERLG